MATFKKCTRCGEVKGVDAFPVRQRKRGPQADSWCRDCYAQRQQKRQAQRLASIEKTCTKCSEVKALDRFPSAKGMIDGRSSWCRDCVRRQQAQWRQQRRETPKVEVDGRECSHCRRFKHRDAFSPSGVSLDGMQSWCKECVAEQKAEGRSSEEGRQRYNAYLREYGRTAKARETRQRYRQSAEYRLKFAARTAVRVAVLAGVLVRPAECSFQGQLGVECRGRIEGHHHNGYDVRHWLDVVWSCQAHHKILERCVDS